MKANTKKPKQTTRSLRRHAKHLVVPHKANHYRPHLIRGYGLVIVLIVAFLGQGIYNYVKSGEFAVLGRQTTTSISGLLADTNKARQANNLALLKLNKKLDQAAYAKGQDMLLHNYWAHTSPSGVQPWSWLSKADYNYNRAGENLAKNYSTSRATVKAWLNSPAHRANLLDDRYSDVGFAVVQGDLENQPTSLVVAYYAEPEAAAVLGTTKTAKANNQFVAPRHQPFNPLASLGSAVQSITPATLGAVILLGFTALVALASHGYRRRLPSSVKRSWRAHHGAYKAVGLVAVAVILIATSGGGQV